MELKRKLELLTRPPALWRPERLRNLDADRESEPESEPKPEPKLESDPERELELDREREARLAKLANLRQQLERLRISAPAPSAQPLAQGGHTRSPTSAALRPDAYASAHALAHVDRALPCSAEETPLGRLHRRVLIHEEDHRHGAVEVAPAARALGSEVAVLALDPALAPLDFARALYIDTETTGLAGGAGTLPFLIGMAWFDGERLVVEQLLLERPGREAPMLTRLAERLRAASTIVSYNGKSFDWPLLRTRFVLNRIAAPRLPGHLDLLHCARRVYKARLGSLRLVHLEQELLGFERLDDLAGELIPQTYLAFLRGLAPASTLTPILDHNRSDLVALPALLGEILRRFRGEHARQDARDQLGFARVAARAAEPVRALALAHAAIASDVRGELAARALFFAGELELRRGDCAAAIAAYERALTLSDGAERARVHLALAKLYEHRTKEPERALAHAKHTAPCEGATASQRRVARLLRRLARHERLAPAD